MIFSGLSAAGIPAIPSIQPKDMGMFVIGLIISFSVAFVITLILGKRAKAA